MTESWYPGKSEGRHRVNGAPLGTGGIPVSPEDTAPKHTEVSVGISDCSSHDDQPLTVEHVERRAAFTKRVNANIGKFRDGGKQLARCSQRKLYAYDQDDVATILAEMRRCVEEVEIAFRKANEAPARNAPWDLTIAKRQRETQASS